MDERPPLRTRLFERLLVGRFSPAAVDRLEGRLLGASGGGHRAGARLAAEREFLQPFEEAGGLFDVATGPFVEGGVFGRFRVERGRDTRAALASVEAGQTRSQALGPEGRAVGAVAIDREAVF